MTIPIGIVGWLTPASLATAPGPQTAPRYAYVASIDRVFQWVSGSTKTADNVCVIAATGGGAGRWEMLRGGNHVGANLTDASVTIYPSGDERRVLPTGTLSTGRTLTLGTTDAVAGDGILVTRLDISANAYAIVNGGAGAGTIATFPVSQRAFLRAVFDGTNWSQAASAVML